MTCREHLWVFFRKVVVFLSQSPLPHETVILEKIEPFQVCLRSYCRILSELNRETRLTGPSEPEILFREHVVDSAFGLDFLPAGPSRVVDVGTGGGLPGVVWAICRPDLEVTLLDSLERKCRALSRIADTLALSNVRVICSRSEELARQDREGFDLAAARAVTHLGPLVELLSPLVRAGGQLLAFKGPSLDQEMAECGGNWEELGLEEPEVKGYSLQGKDRRLVVWKKISPCPFRYPRRPGMADKRPWWR